MERISYWKYYLYLTIKTLLASFLILKGILKKSVWHYKSFLYIIDIFQLLLYCISLFEVKIYTK